MEGEERRIPNRSPWMKCCEYESSRLICAAHEDRSEEKRGKSDGKVARVILCVCGSGGWRRTAQNLKFQVTDSRLDWNNVTADRAFFFLSLNYSDHSRYFFLYSLSAKLSATVDFILSPPCFYFLHNGTKLFECDHLSCLCARPKRDEFKERTELFFLSSEIFLHSCNTSFISVKLLKRGLC